MRQLNTIRVCGLWATIIVLAACAPQTRGAQTASDNANNGYSGNWTNVNGGSGFAIWSNVQLGNGGNFFTGSSTADSHHIAPGIDVGGKSWGMFANGTAVGTNYARVNRQFTAGATPNVSLQPGQTFTVDMDNGFINTSGFVGFSLQNSSTNDVFSFTFIGGGSLYQINGATPANSIGYTNAGLRISVTLTSSTTYSCSVNRPNTGTAITNTGNLLNPAGGQAIDRVVFFTNGAGLGGDYDLFFNSLSITCPDALTIPASPTNLAVCPAGNAAFNVTATGDSPAFQWQKNGINISNGGTIGGATSSNLTLTGVSAGDSGSNFECLVTDACGNTQTSAQAVLTVNAPPSITAGTPADQSPCAGANATFTVTANGTGLTYQWHKNGANIGNGGSISGATTSNLTLTGVSASDSGSNFECVVTGVCSLSSTSHAALLTVVNNAAIQSGPTNATACSGGNAIFTIGATGVNAYQWFKGATSLTDSGSINGSATATLTLTGVGPGDSGATFNCLITGCGAVQLASSTGTLSVVAAPGISASPTNLTVCAGGNASFTVTASNAAGYQWKKGATPLTDGGTISGSATPTLTLTGVGAGDNNASFSCVVSGSSPCSPATSGPGSLTVNSSPGISIQPMPQSPCVGGNASFSVTATNAVNYHWQKGNAPLTDGGSIIGSATPTLTLTNLTVGDSGATFSCVIGGNSPCLPAISSPATLTVNVGPPAITNQPAAQSVCSNATAVFTAGATGSPTYLWRKRGAGWGGGGWQLSASGVVGSSSNGFFVNTSTTNAGGDSNGDGDIDTAGQAWGIYANGGNEAAAVRPLNGALAVGDTFRIDMDNGFVNAGLANNGTSNSVGFALVDTTGGQRFNFRFEGGRNNYFINDSVLNRDTGAGFTGEGLHVAFTLTSTDTYSVTISAVGTNQSPVSPITITGTLGDVSGSSINRLQIFNNNAGTGGTFDAFFNSISFGCQDDNAAGYSSATWTNGSDFGNAPLANGATGTGSAIAGANTSSLTVSNGGTADLAGYDVCVTNACGITTSAAAALSLAQCGPYVSVSNTVGSSVIEARVYQNDGYVTLTGPDLNGNPGAVTLTFPPGSVNSGGNNYQIGPVLNSTTISNGVQVVQSLGPTSIVVQVTFPYPGVMHYEVVNWGGLPLTATCLTVPSDSSEHFYGFGEQFNSFDEAGNKLDILSANSEYKVAPWFISTHGYGFHLDTTDESWFDMRSSYSDRYVISNMVGSTFSGYTTNALKYNVVYGPNLADVLTRYTGYSGRAPLMPAWAFAPWMSSDVWSSGGEVRYVITKLRERGIPGSVFVFDSPWETAYNDYNWNMAQFGATGFFEGTNWPGFATSADMMTFLRTNGYKTVLWMTPWLNTNSIAECYSNALYNVCPVPGYSSGQSSNYASALASNYFVHAVSSGATNVLTVDWWKGTGSPIDFTNPNATRWLQGVLSNLIAQSGNVIGGFKSDDGESEGGTVFIPTNALYADGRTGIEMRNGYSVEFQKSIWNVLGTNGVISARGGYTGTQAYPAYWAGDNDPNFGLTNGMQGVMIRGLTAAMSGYSMWSMDICGYNDANWSSTPTNLFMRWTQFGALSPVMTMHRQVTFSWQYPWSFGEAALTNYVEACRLRVSLFPYIYSSALESSTNGLPVLRPLVLMNQSDPNTYAMRDEYLFGTQLLVAPIATNLVTSRPVYLPQGNWYDYWTSQRYTGGQTSTWSNADLTKFPLFVREGGILPMISTNTQTFVDSGYSGNASLVTLSNALEFQVYPTTNSSFTVYDGTSLNCQSIGTVIAATLNSVARPMLLRFFAGQPFGVERNGVPLPSYGSAAGLAAATLGWYYDAPSGFLQVKFNHTGGAATISFGPDSVGDGISDSWRAYWFGNANATATNLQNCAVCDADGTGQDNLFKYAAGLNPTNPASIFNTQNIGFQVTGGTNGFNVSWQTQPGIQYQVLWKNLMDPTVPWQTNATLFTGDGTVFSWFDDGTATGTLPLNSPTGSRFYKVIVP